VSDDGDDTQGFNCITQAANMPVCLHGDRLTFTQDAALVSYPIVGVQLYRYEKAGDSWDGASIPRLFWSIIGHPLQQEFRWASYWHDKLCDHGFTWSQRRFADAVLLVLLEQERVAYWRRTAMWLAVRAYAWLWWSWSNWR